VRLYLESSERILMAMSRFINQKFLAGTLKDG
jgi:hypothetical protein